MGDSQTSQSFEQLHPKVQKWIWDKGWTELRDIQEQAIQALLGEPQDVILAASTASGKTEAAFIPLSSRLAEHPEAPGIRLLYISPLKALINDQFMRLTDLFEVLTIPVHRWHGDVSQHHKKRLLKQPAGILLITPESLEALFMLHGQSLWAVFGCLEAVVIDELHAFIGSERGCQLQSLLGRLDVILKRPVPRIGLSATLGDMQMAAEFMRPSSHAPHLPCQLIQSNTNGSALMIQVRGECYGAQPQHSEAEPEEECTYHIFHHMRNSTNLIFANRRGQVEYYTDALNQLCRRSGMPEVFVAHHGSLSKALREDAEARLKDTTQPVTAVCTSTLEMGIDIGQVYSVAQIGCPPSVANLRQRLGRSGRRGEPAILRNYITVTALDTQSSVADRLRFPLIQACAMIELMLQKWCEPPNTKRFHFSTCVQQILSLIVQYGGLRATELWQILGERGAFQQIGKADFITLLRYLGAKSLVFQMDNGTLLLDRKGEQLVNHYSFYAAFQTPEEYRLVAEGQTLGTLPIDRALYPDAVVIFGGRRWRVVSIDERVKVIELRASASGRVPKFTSGGSGIHRRVREEMRKLYLSHTMPRYLNAKAQSLLEEARHNFLVLGLAESDVIQEDGLVFIFPWTGSQELATLCLQFKHQGLASASDYLDMAIQLENVPVSEVNMAWSSIQHKELKIDDLTQMLDLEQVPLHSDKHDEFVPTELLKKEFVARYLCI